MALTEKRDILVGILGDRPIFYRSCSMGLLSYARGDLNASRRKPGQVFIWTARGDEIGSR